MAFIYVFLLWDSLLFLWLKSKDIWARCPAADRPDASRMVLHGGWQSACPSQHCLTHRSRAPAAFSEPQFSCFRAQVSRFALFPHLRNGFLAASLPYRQFLGSVDGSTGVPLVSAGPEISQGSQLYLPFICCAAFPVLNLAHFFVLLQKTWGGLADAGWPPWLVGPVAMTTFGRICKMEYIF